MTVGVLEPDLPEQVWVMRPESFHRLVVLGRQVLVELVVAVSP